MPTDFTFTSTGTTTFSVLRGTPVTYTFSLAPVGGAYPGTVYLSVYGLPYGGTATFSPSSVPANGGPTTIQMTVQTSTVLAQDHRRLPLQRGPFLALVLLPFLALGRVRRRLRAHSVVGILLCATLLGGLVGCTADVINPETDPITVTAVSGPIAHTATVKLTVNFTQ